MIKKREIIVNDLLTHYLEGGSLIAKTTILFLHGWRSSSEVWMDILPHFENKYRVIALDLPGFGKTQTPLETFNTDKYADFVISFIKKFRLEDVIAIGHSYGGRVLLNSAINNRFPFAKIFLVNSSGIKLNTNSTSMLKTIAKLLKPLFKFKVLKKVREKIYTMLGAEDYLHAQTSDFFKKTYANIITDIYNTKLDRVRLETVVISSDKDNSTPLDTAKFLAAKIKGAKLEVIGGAGHFSFLDKRNEFIKVLEENL